MILVDTSVWIDHLRIGDPDLAEALENNRVLIHPWIVGELALGNLGAGDTRSLLELLPRTTVASENETLRLIDRESLRGRGIGYVDAQLLAATRLTADARMWTRDRRLADVATKLGIGFG